MADQFNVRAETFDGELTIEGDANAFDELGEAIRTGWRGTRRIRTTRDLAGAPVRTVSVVEVAEGGVRLSVDGEVLAVIGSAPALAKLAANLGAVRQVVAPGSHTHWDYFPGHPFLAPESVPTIVVRTE